MSKFDHFSDKKGYGNFGNIENTSRNGTYLKKKDISMLFHLDKYQGKNHDTIHTP